MVTGLIFSLSDVTLPREVPFHSMCNAFFMDLPASSFVFHSSLLTVKSINLVWLHVMAFFALRAFTIYALCNEKSSVFFIVATFITEVLFEQFLIRTAV